jgi:hypothetical protein
VLKFGGGRVLTKHVNDALGLDDLKVEVVPQIIDNTLVIGATQIAHKPRGRVKARVAKTRVAAKRGRLEKAVGHLYDLEDNTDAEKLLNIDFGLYQMEDC